MNQILQQESDKIENYKSTVYREMTRISAFSRNNGIERFPEFANYEDIDDAKNKALVLFAEITENIRVCQKYWTYFIY